MLRAEIEGESLNDVTDISEICKHKQMHHGSGFLHACILMGPFHSTTLLSLALTHTWLYSLLKECVSSRKHCRGRKETTLNHT